MSVAVSTTDRHASRLAAFVQAADRPMFKDLKSDSTTRNHVYLLVVSSLVAASRLPLRLPGDGPEWGSCAQCGQRITVLYLLQ